MTGRTKIRDRDAALLASHALGQSVTVNAVRLWRTRDHVKGGRGWVEGRSLLAYIDHRLGCHVRAG